MSLYWYGLCAVFLLVFHVHCLFSCKLLLYLSSTITPSIPPLTLPFVCYYWVHFVGIEISGNICDGSMEGIRLSMGSSYNKIFDNEVVNTIDRELLPSPLHILSGHFVFFTIC